MGASCVSSQYSQPCVDGAYFMGATCRAGKAEGAACDPMAQECASGLACEAGTCTAVSCTDPTP
ncbi:MAG: hypothetical protein FJ086_10975 [Deltaproteobacteria bacterium]|nr:hypothetical protein [Deltaproteobacteria bacterium]